MENNNNIFMHSDDNISIDQDSIRKMVFIYNSLNNGWSVKKRNDSYVFTKKHEGRKEVFSDDYLKTFIVRNMNNVKLSD